MITSYSSSDDEITSSTCEHVILVKVMLMMAGSNQKIYISEASATTAIKYQWIL
jgi:hypothetical protein